MKKFNKKAVLSALIGFSLVCSVNSCNAMECYGQKDNKNVTFLYGGNFFKNGFDLEYNETTLFDAVCLSVGNFDEVNSLHQKAIDNIKNGTEIYVFYRDEKGVLGGYMCLLKQCFYDIYGIQQKSWIVKEARTFSQESDERQKAADKLIEELKNKDLCELLDHNSKQVSLTFEHWNLDCYDSHICAAWRDNFNSDTWTWKK